ncbi:MAG: hypothetical protein PHS04_00710 [Tissierellia bacterium]|nr:hypothetical protein [Tissierellia bacterium]
MEIIAHRHRPLIAIGKKLLTCHFGGIYLLNVNNKKSEFICKLPIDAFKRLASRSRLLERLLRLEVKATVAITETQLLLSYRGDIYRIDLDEKTIVKEHTYRSGMNNSLSFSKIEGVKGFDDCIAYGEYTLNPRRENSSAIYVRSLLSADWKKVFEFSAGTVRHIHGIAPDKAAGCVYILTGDLDNESGIWVSRDNFKTVKPIMSGAQKYRTGFWYSVKDGYLYPTDTATEQNYIYFATQRLDGSWQIKSVSDIDGSCISALDTDDKVYISTTVEADESITGWKSWINYKKGAGIKSDYAQLLAVDKQNLSVKKIAHFKKDILPYKLFQYGSVLIVNLPDCKSIAVYPVGVKKFDAKLLLIEYGDDEVI